jgi:hypothetical protein
MIRVNVVIKLYSIAVNPRSSLKSNPIFRNIVNHPHLPYSPLELSLTDRNLNFRLSPASRVCHSLSTFACATTTIPDGFHEVQRVNGSIALLIEILSWAGVFGFVSALIAGAVG